MQLTPAQLDCNKKRHEVAFFMGAESDLFTGIEKHLFMGIEKPHHPERGETVYHGYPHFLWISCFKVSE